MTSLVGDRPILDYAEREFGLSYYSQIVEYIARDLVPEQVFSFDDLKMWANDQGLEDLFTQGELEAWAENNGFVLE